MVLSRSIWANSSTPPYTINSISRYLTGRDNARERMSGRSPMQARWNRSRMRNLRKSSRKPCTQSTQNQFSLSLRPSATSSPSNLRQQTSNQPRNPRKFPRVKNQKSSSFGAVCLQATPRFLSALNPSKPNRRRPWPRRRTMTTASSTASRPFRSLRSNKRKRKGAE